MGVLVICVLVLLCFVLFPLCIFIRICFACTSVRTTAQSDNSIADNNNDNNNNNKYRVPYLRNNRSENLKFRSRNSVSELQQH